MYGRGRCKTVFEQLRERSQDAIHTSVSARRPSDRLVGLRRITRPQMTALLAEVSALLTGWTTANDGTGGLRLPDARGRVRQPSHAELAARLAGPPDIFFQALIGLQSSTLMTAYLQLERSDAMRALEAAQAAVAERTNPTILAAGLHRESMPGLCVTGGLGFVAAEKFRAVGDTQRRRERCTQLLRRMGWMTLDWAAQSQVGFGCLQEGLSWASPREPAVNPLQEVNFLMNCAARVYPIIAQILGEPGSEAQEAPFWLLDPRRFELEIESEGEILVIDQGVCEYVVNFWDTVARLNPDASAFRVNCPALGVKIGGVSLVEHSVLWTANLVDLFWEAIEW